MKNPYLKFVIRSSGFEPIERIKITMGNIREHYTLIPLRSCKAFFP